jgi:DNA-binding response OmpR family regulator
VVEDDADYVRLLQLLLEGMGFVVDSVGRLADVRWYIGRNYELITLDLRLPDADGTQTLQAVRPAFPTAVIMVISGSMDEAKAVELLRLGADHCALKPGNPDNFIRDVERTLAMKNPAKVLAEIEHRTEGLK